MPHIIKPISGAAENVVVVGAGPAGLEAARVISARGHNVTVLEAAPEAGGQVRLAARSPRRSELIGIIDWRLTQCEKNGVKFKYNLLADTQDVLSLEPDKIVISTGGLPNWDILEEGSDMAVSSWDIISEDVKPGTQVLLYDDNGGHPGMQAAEWLVDSGSIVEIISPERFFAPEMGGLNHVPYAKKFQDNNVQITINSRLLAIEKHGNALKCRIGSDYSDNVTERTVDQVVIEHGTLPIDDLYFDLKPQSKNLGAINYKNLIGTGPLFPVKNSDGKFDLLRIGDAVSSRNIHSAIYDGLRFGISL